MAAIAFDTLKFARRLKEVGVPEAQAEAQAELMAEAFVFNMDALVTKDYLEQCLDARFAAQDARIGARFSDMEKQFDERFSGMEKRFEARSAEVEGRFAGMESRFEKQDRRFEDQDRRFAAIDQFMVDQRDCNAGFESHFNKIDLVLTDIRGELKLLRWMLALIIVTTVIPVLQRWFTEFVFVS